MTACVYAFIFQDFCLIFDYELKLLFKSKYTNRSICFECFSTKSFARTGIVRKLSRIWLCHFCEIQFKCEWDFICANSGMALNVGGELLWCFTDFTPQDHVCTCMCFDGEGAGSMGWFVLSKMF